MRTIEQPDIDQLLSSNKFNSLSAHPHLEARLRQKVSPAEAGIALQALTRRDLLEPAARVELFDSLAQHFKTKVNFPPDAIEGIEWNAMHWYLARVHSADRVLLIGGE